MTDMGEVAQFTQVALIAIVFAFLLLGLVRFLRSLGQHIVENSDDEFEQRVFGISEERERGSVRVQEDVEQMAERSNEEWLARRREQDAFRRSVKDTPVDKAMASSNQAGRAARPSRVSREALERQRHLRISQGKLSARFDGKPNRSDEDGIIEARAREQRQERKERYRNERFFKRNSSGL